MADFNRCYMLCFGQAVTGATGATGMTTPTQSSPSPAPPSEIGDAQSEIGSTAYGDASNVVEGRYDTTPTDWKWIILDGPVDTIWVENLNTVLDDSKILCLANGERISLTPGMRLVFEVDDLAAASPATISRCAMVYMVSPRIAWSSTLLYDLKEDGHCAKLWKGHQWKTLTCWPCLEII